MYQMKKLPYNYIPDHSVQILELPYVADELSMFILLPEEPKDGSNPLLKVQDIKQDIIFGCVMRNMKYDERPWRECIDCVVPAGK